jgi:hypothetical protein
MPIQNKRLNDRNDEIKMPQSHTNQRYSAILAEIRPFYPVFSFFLMLVYKFAKIITTGMSVQKVPVARLAKPPKTEC